MKLCTIGYIVQELAKSLQNKMKSIRKKIECAQAGLVEDLSVIPDSLFLNGKC